MWDIEWEIKGVIALIGLFAVLIFFLCGLIISIKGDQIRSMKFTAFALVTFSSVGVFVAYFSNDLDLGTVRNLKIGSFVLLTLSALFYGSYSLLSRDESKD